MTLPEPDRAAEATLQEIVSLFQTTGGEPSEAVCPICRLVARSVERAVRALFAEFVNDPQTREGLRRARGFCPEHTPLLAALGDALAVAILYSDLARLTRERWLTAGSSGRWRGFRRGRRAPDPPSAPCPACLAAREAERRYTAALAAGLESADVWTALQAGSGLCVLHAEQVMARARPASAARLRALEAARLAALQAELEEIIRKNDYRFRQEAWGEERDAWLRALYKLLRPDSRNP